MELSKIRVRQFQGIFGEEIYEEGNKALYSEKCG